MKFSVWPNPSNDPAEVLDTARWADRAGWHGVWYADHYMPNSADGEVLRGTVHECWAMLPAIAASTEHVRVGPLVSPTSVHHPAVLANRAATIDHLSSGRMVLGIGAGWQVNEHRAYGIELEPPGARVSRFDEAIQIIRSLLSDESTTFDGDFYRVSGAPADPGPVQSPLPILVGTGSPRMLRITARHADEWNTWGAPALAADRRSAFRAACDRVGRDADTMWTSVQAHLHITDDVSVIEAVRNGPLGERSLVGTVDEIAAQLAEYESLGFDEFIVPDFNLGTSPGERHDALARIDAELVSQFR